MRILLIEDDAKVASLVSHGLKEAGFAVDHAVDGEEGLRLALTKAYYWAYGKNLDFSYLDHPPMVAWLIRISTSLLGNSELAVRIPSNLCSLVALIYLFALTNNLYGRATVCVSTT